MAKVAIITDSNSGITQKEAKELGIRVVPMPFMIDGEEYLEDITLTQEQFYEKYLYEQELFWNNIMKEHAQVIRELLDPTEKDLILTADNYAKEYEAIIKQYSNNLDNIKNVSLNETINFRNFKIAGEEGILNCKIKSIIIPLLADHVLREANHFIRILKNTNNIY